MKKTIQKLLLSILALLFTTTCLYAQTVKVTGIVTDKKGVTIPGVSVKLKGTMLVVQSGGDGKYTITLPQADANAVLVFSYIGFIAKEEIVGKRKSINVTLEESLSDLDEVVVIGYGTAKKRDLTGAIATITDKTIEEKSPVSIFDAIQGEATGVQITSNSGAPGASSDIRVRGASTFEGGVFPLYIVDGVPQADISMINPSDVKSIEILKDAASAAIYGSRSANGVIIVTTKTGELGKPKVALSYLRSYSKLSNKISQANKFNAKIFGSKTGTISAAEAIDSLYIGTNASNDYLSLVTQTGTRDQIDFSTSGATKDVNYFASLGYLQETGIVIESFGKRLTGRVNVAYNFTSKLKFNTRLNFSYGNRNNISEGRVIAGSIIRPPQFILFYPDGSYAYNIAGVRNPLAEARFAKDLTASYRGTLFQNAEYTFSKSLKFQTSITADMSYDDNTKFSSKVLDTGNPSIGKLSDKTSFGKHFLSESFFSFNRTFATDHTVGAVLGVSGETFSTDYNNIAGSRLVSESVLTLNSVQDIDIANTFTDATENKMLSAFGRVNYSYKGKYLLSGTLRRDGSSRFTKEQWGTYPSASAAWRASDEKFMNWTKKYKVEDLKFRASWGKTGNERVGDYESFNRFILGGTYTYMGVGGVVPNTIFGNPDLSWETSTSTNFGLDLSMFKGRLSSTIDYYIKDTDHLLYSAQMPSELGYNNVKINLGKIRNSGFELNISGIPIKTASFTWQTSINYSRNDNKILQLAKDDYVASSKWLVGKDQPIGQWYGFKNLGIYQYDESNAYTADYSQRLIPQFQRDAYGNVIFEKSGIPTLTGYKYQDGSDYGWDPKTNPVYQLYAQGNVSKGGDVIWQNLPDANGKFNNQIDDNDRRVLGSAVAKWFGGWSNTFTYKGLSLYTSFYGSFGNLLYNKQRADLVIYSSSNATPWPYDIMNAWKFQGQITDVPIASKGTTNNMRELNSYFLEDGSFLRLRNVRLSYRLDNKIAKMLHMTGFTAYVYGNNLVTWTNYKGFDPEFSGGILTPGEDSGKYPRKKEYGFGVNLNF